MHILSTMLCFISPACMLNVLIYTEYLALEYNSTKLSIPDVSDIGILYSYVT